MSEPARSNVRILLPEQTRELVDLHVSAPSSISDEPQRVVLAISEIVGTKTALVGRENGTWTILAESAAADDLGPTPAPGTIGDMLDRVGDASSVTVECWRSGDEEWTFVGLPRRASTAAAVLMLRHDWTLSSSGLRQLGENLLRAERAHILSSSARVRVAAHRLTRALARSTGYAGVADIAVRHVARAVRAQIATLAVADGDDQVLRIMATIGYPVKLVEHLRIGRGVGIMGSVYQTALPLLVTDVATYHGTRKRRTRYRTNSFAAVPITTANEVLGVLCVTDRTDGRPFTRTDLSTLRTLAGPLALALGRERALAQAGSYAEAAAIDPVSGLFNRRYFHTRIQEELQRAQRHALSVGLLMIDVDDFKAVNDTYGHLVGDTVIRSIADILRRSVRVFDICTRFGGEEFAVVMPGSAADDAARIAERIRQRVQNSSSADPGLASLKVTVSIGLAVSRPDMSPRDLIGGADMALYQAKRAGKNRVRTAGTGEGGGTSPSSPAI
ncbi:MAG TPA: sensor domain-containing diguanylate cyclase [Vicinamibacterales bacterium]|nr:sensor domain-containing diguanylate cyclase [Vicinamibacterales bacterium]